MNYLTQIIKFCELQLINPVSANAQCLYIQLLYVNNKCGWIEEFSVANSTICSLTSLSRTALDRSRNELIQKGYLNYKKSARKNQAGKYSIVRFDTQDDIQNDTQSDTQNDIQM